MNTTKKYNHTASMSVLAAAVAVAVAAAFALATVSCATKIANVDPGASVAEIVQMGQNSEERNRYNAAILYYEMIKERFPSDLVAVAGADYAIGHCHYKQGKYVTAREELNDLLAIYDSKQGASLPKKYQVLAGKVLDLIAQKTKVVADE
jgi:outer membrane protein assembly factor BamD (BamD/ComL family)